jgi:hypothetical protein
MEDLIRPMTPVAAPPEQQAQVAALSKALEGMTCDISTALTRRPREVRVDLTTNSIGLPCATRHYG